MAKVIQVIDLGDIDAVRITCGRSGCEAETLVRLEGNSVEMPTHCPRCSMRWARTWGRRQDGPSELGLLRFVLIELPMGPTLALPSDSRWRTQTVKGGRDE